MVIVNCFSWEDHLDEFCCNGTFYYPKIDLLATALYSEDIVELPITHPREREKIMYLREHPIHVAKEKSPFKNHYIHIHYAVLLTSVNPKEFHINYLPFNVI